MTQKKEGLSKSQPIPMLIAMVEVDEQSEDKNDSEMCHMSLSEQAEQKVKELNSMHGQAKKKIEELIEILRTKDKLKDHEIKKVLFDRVDFVSRRTLYRALPEDIKREYTKPLPKTINVTTEYKMIDLTPEEHEEIKPIDSEEINKLAEKFKPEEEEPTELELAQIKIKQLEETMHKVQHFQPATQLQDPLVKEVLDRIPESSFDWLKKQADGIHSFYYDAYGIDLFKNRELAQLKNSGVKVFRRLYFEV